jgi:hypothetical protein
MSQIQRGDRVRVRSAFGNYLDRWALSGVEMGHNFQVIWVCSKEEMVAAEAEGRDPKGTPWPASDVELAEQPAPA